MLWRVIAASEIGTRHVRDGLPCQDRCEHRQTIHEQSGERYFVSAVADGAGTAAQSEIGATVATQTAVDLAIRLIEDRGSGFTDRDVTACFEAVHDALEFEAQQV